jgi:hypothetical protein
MTAFYVEIYVNWTNQIIKPFNLSQPILTDRRYHIVDNFKEIKVER